MIRVAVYISFIVLLACSRPVVILDKLVVLNATDGTITDVIIRHEPTKRFGEVNMILPGKIFEIGLAESGVPMMSSQAIIHWRDSQGIEWSATLDLPGYQTVETNPKPVTLNYVINSNGHAGVYLRE